MRTAARRPGGKTGFFASDRKGGFGDWIFTSLNFLKTFGLKDHNFVKGKVYNAKTKEALEANFECWIPKQAKHLPDLLPNRMANFFVTLTARNFLVNVNKEGYLFYSRPFQF